MSTSVAPIDLPAAPQNGLAAGLARLDKAQKIKLGAGVLGLLAIALAFYFMGKEPEWKVLYANLSDKDGGAIVAQLSQMNVPYKHTDGGGAIMVPTDKVHDVRLRLASQGLPKGSVTGFELMEANRFGMTQFQERLTFQRGLEGELTRSIQSLSSVQAARVHLALPNQNGFFREQQKPTASVLLTLHPGRTLDKAQIAGIVHLVAASVPEMNPKAVSIVDDAGALLSATGEEQQGVDLQRLKYTQQIEQMYTRRILDMIEPLVGAENVKAQVSAELDFSQVESTSEQHKPNQGGEPGTVRSQQMVEDGTPPQALPAGVPGAVSNQPPATGTAPINGEAAPLGVASNADKAGNSRRESVINYEVDKTVKVVREASGTVKRLTAAVVVNHRGGTDAKTGQPTSTPIPPEQIEQMNALVRETIGFSKDRGDSVNVINAPFNAPKAGDAVAPAWWAVPDNQALVRELAFPGGMVLMALLVLLGLVRPALKAMKAPAPLPLPAPEPPQLSAVLDEPTERPALPVPEPVDDNPTPEQLRLVDAKRLALENPLAVANIVKGWVNGEAPT